MQVLILVFTILLALTLMTNSQWQAHIASQAIRSSYHDYLVRRQEREFNEEQTRLYNRLRKEATPKDQTDPGGKKTTAKALNPRLNFALALNSLDKGNPYRTVIKRLLRNTYSPFEFYRRAEGIFPGLEEQLLIVIEDALNRVDNKNSQLAQLDLGHPQLQEAFYRMLKGTREPLLGNLEEGYPSLLDLVELGKKSQEISIYHARTEVLLAIFEEVDVVNAILKMRWKLYKAAQEEGTNLDILGQEFAQAFQFDRLSEAAVIPLDFSVNKEPPPKY